MFSGLYLFSVFYFRNAKPMGVHVCYYCGTKLDNIAALPGKTPAQCFKISAAHT
jgi:hypothetical protein